MLLSIALVVGKFACFCLVDQKPKAPRDVCCQEQNHQGEEQLEEDYKGKGKVVEDRLDLVAGLSEVEEAPQFEEKQVRIEVVVIDVKKREMIGYGDTGSDWQPSYDDEAVSKDLLGSESSSVLRTEIKVQGSQTVVMRGEPMQGKPNDQVQYIETFNENLQGKVDTVGETGNRDPEEY